MAHSFAYKDLKFGIGDTVDVNYRIVEGEKERIQKFTGIILKVRGASEARRMITVRKISRSGIGVERILPLASPFIADIKLAKKSRYQKAKAYFVRGLSDQQTRRKLYRPKSLNLVKSH